MKPLIFRNQNFLFVWLGQVLSQAGTRMYQIALLWWLISEVSEFEQGFGVGLFMVLGALPSVLMVKWIGRILERNSSKKVMFIAEIFACIGVSIIGLLLLNNSLSIGAVYISGFCIAVFQAFIDPSLPKSVPELVSDNDVEEAIAFETSTQSLANFAGAVFGAILIDQIGFVGVIAFNSASYLLSAIFLSMAKFRPVASSNAAAQDDKQKLEGFRLLKQMPFIKKVLIAFGLANFFATPTIIIIPLYTKVVLNKGATELGILEACLWIGLILGAFSARWFNFAKSITMLGGICIAVFGVALGLPGVFTSLPLYMVSLAVGGWCLGLNNVKFITLFQMEVPGHLKGRFFAIMQAMISFTFPMAYFTFGVLADVLPIQTVCLVQGIGLVAAGVVLAFFIKKPTSTSTDDQSCGLEAAEGGNSPTFGP